MKTVLVVIVVAQVSAGWASHYDRGVAQSVIHVRQTHRGLAALPERLPSVDGYIAVEDCSKIGDIWMLRPEGNLAWESFLVIDCSGSAETSAWMTRNNIVVEVDFETLKRWGGRRHRGMRIERLQYFQAAAFGRRIDAGEHPQYNLYRQEEH